jgi:hypothetical protein
MNGPPEVAPRFGHCGPVKALKLKYDGTVSGQGYPKRIFTILPC